jgi:hypothetical protein
MTHASWSAIKRLKAHLESGINKHRPLFSVLFLLLPLPLREKRKGKKKKDGKKNKRKTNV